MPGTGGRGLSPESCDAQAFCCLFPGTLPLGFSKLWTLFRLDGHEFEQALGVGEGQGSLVCCSPWGCKESDTTEQLSSTLFWVKFRVILPLRNSLGNVGGWLLENQELSKERGCVYCCGEFHLCLRSLRCSVHAYAELEDNKNLGCINRDAVSRIRKVRPPHPQHQWLDHTWGIAMSSEKHIF